nr:NAD(P)H-dependent oxidoreductase [Allomuricauda sp.]
MKTLLRIDSSPRRIGSHSREMADYFEATWKTENPKGKVIHRDLEAVQMPHIGNRTIEGFHVAPHEANAEQQNAVQLSNQLIGELKKADEILVSSPLYNLNVPSSLKAYLDHVVRAGHTFGVDKRGYHGLLTNKKAFLITAKGSVYKDTPMEKLDFQEPYLKAIFQFMGIPVDQSYVLEGTSNPIIAQDNKKRIQEEIDQTLKIYTHE